MAIGNFLESLSQQILAGKISLGRLGVDALLRATIGQTEVESSRARSGALAVIAPPTPLAGGLVR